MPISEKIIAEINKSDADNSEKRLMLELLTIEDEGVYRYVGPYEKLINKYLGDKESATYGEGGRDT